MDNYRTGKTRERGSQKLFGPKRPGGVAGQPSVLKAREEAASAHPASLHSGSVKTPTYIHASFGLATHLQQTIALCFHPFV